MEKTVQLIRYELTPDGVDEFVEWWTAKLMPARHDFGFSLEFAYLDRSASVFTWGVSLPVGPREFALRDDDWAVSEGRMAALNGTRQRVRNIQMRIVDPVAPQ